MESPVKVLHLSPWIKTIGGMETLLALHAMADRAGGLDAWQVSLFDRISPAPGEAYSTQHFFWGSTPRAMRRAMAPVFAQRKDSVVIWHSGWGIPWLADIDGSRRRIVSLHDNMIHYRSRLPYYAPMMDGIICPNESMARSVRQMMPELEAGRLTVAPVPIMPPRELSATRTVRGEWVIGCAGRVARPHKGMQRLVPFVAELRRLGVNCRVEIMGDGPLREWLERRLKHDPGVRFLGWQDVGSYWRRLENWDAVVCFSDHESGPITLIEAMAAGAIPIYPAIGGSLGDDYAPRVDPRCYYPPGDWAAAARAVQTMRGLPGTDVAALRQRARALVQPHCDAGAYTSKVAEFVRRISTLPRISPEPVRNRRPRLADWLPLGLLTRLLPESLLR